MERLIDRTPLTREIVKAMLECIAEEIFSIEQKFYLKATNPKTRSLTLHDLQDRDVMSSHMLKASNDFLGRLEDIAGNKSKAASDVMKLLERLVQVTHYGMGCIILTIHIFSLEVFSEIKRKKFNVDSNQVYSDSVKKELIAVQNDELFIADLVEFLFHKCSTPTFEGEVNNKCSLECSSRLDGGMLKVRYEKRRLTKTSRKFQIRNSIMKNHCKLPLTSAENYHCHLYPYHSKLFDEHAGQLDSPHTIHLVILMFNPETIVEHALYIRVWNKSNRTDSYSDLLKRIVKLFNKYYQKYSLLDKRRCIHDIKLSRYNLSLIEEHKPAFEDGEILWINHVQHERIDHQCIDCDCYSTTLSPWCVISNENGSFPDISDTSLCWWCFKAVGTPCERCGTANYCSEKCHELAWPSHHKYCRGQPRISRTPEQSRAHAESMLTQLKRSLFTSILIFEKDLFEKHRTRTEEQIIIHHTSTANFMYERLIQYPRLQLVLGDGIILDPYHHYDPVCLIFRIIRMSIRFHSMVSSSRLSFGNRNVYAQNESELERLWTKDFVHSEVKLLDHYCVNSAKLQVLPEKYGNRFTKDMFVDRSIYLTIHLPFTELNRQYKRIGYDFGGSKCDKLARELQLGMDKSLGEGKLLWFFMANSETAVASCGSVFVKREDTYNLREIERTILQTIKHNHEGPLHVTDAYLEIRLSRFNLELITGDTATFDDGEVIIVNHVYYYSPYLDCKLWRVLIQDARRNLANPELCNWCFSKIGLACSSCKKVVYCSTECQNLHWGCHKFDCSGGDDLIKSIVQRKKTMRALTEGIDPAKPYFQVYLVSDVISK
jgi:hypothetical protein